MSTKSQLTKDLNESVTALLDKRIKILFKNVVRLETKSDKTENRVLVFSPCRLFLLTAKIPTRIDCHYHYLEIRGIETRKTNHLSFLIGEKWLTFVCQNEVEIQTMLGSLSTALQVIFPGVSLQQVIEGKVSVECSFESRVRSTCHSPCGAFSTQYACMCDFHGLPYREEVAWDVDTIYASHGTRELSLRDFDHLEPKDLVPIVSALEHNLWFTSLRASSIKLTHEALDRILHVIARTSTLSSIHLNNLSLKHDFVSRMATAVIANPSLPLHSVDLSNNLIEDKSVTSLNNILTKIVQGGKQGLLAIDFSSCGLGPKGVGTLFLNLASLRPQTLVSINISHNNIKDEISGLCSLLAEPNNITHLNISSTEIVLDSTICCQVFGALLRGCTTHLSHLDISRNAFGLKKSTREMPPSFKQFFTSSLCLKYLNVSHCKLPMEALKNLLLGLACNESTGSLTLDLSGNCLGSQGAHVLESCIHGVRAVSSLDISDNGLESELGGVLTAIGRNKSIVELKISRNLVSMKPKHISPVVEALVHMIQEDDCVLETLNMSDCRLKSEIHPVINALGSNQCLKHLDISGNSMGDSGARLLAKALQTNNKLKSIILDKNNITINGYSEIAYALTSNTTVVYLGSLVHDLIACTKVSHVDKVEQIMCSISDCLYSNTNPALTAPLILNTAPSHHRNSRNRSTSSNSWSCNAQQQALERAIQATAEVIRTSSEGGNASLGTSPAPSGTGSVGSGSAEVQAPHPAITTLLHDAEAAKLMHVKLAGVLDSGDIATAVQGRLTQAAQEIHAMLQQHLQSKVDEMLTVAKETCPSVLNDNLVSSLRVRACNKLSSTQQATITPPPHIANQANESGISIANHLAERITEEIIDLLTKAQQSMTGDKRSSTPDVLRTMHRQPTDPTHPMATPQLMSRRKSAMMRKLRPNSVVDTFSAEHIPDLLPSITSPQEGLDWESLDSVCESSGQRLQHLVKGRPRRTKTRAPTRPVNHLPNSIPTDTDECDTDNQSTLSEISSLPTPKPRPWSALCNDKSEGWSEASTATNTPDSTDPPSLNSTEGQPAEKKSIVKEAVAKIDEKLESS